MTMPGRPRLYLIDGYALIYRAFHALGGGTPLDTTAEVSILRAAARHGDLALWNQLAAAAKAAPSPTEHYRFLYALTAFEDPALIDLGLQMTLTDDIRSQDAATFVGSFLGNAAAVLTANAGDLSIYSTTNSGNGLNNSGAMSAKSMTLVGESNNTNSAVLLGGTLTLVAGGTSMPKGFDAMFKRVLEQAKITNLKLGDVIRPQDPLYSVARGCLIAAENAK